MTNADATSEDGSTDYRLPRSVVPRRYALEIAPDLAGSTFAGTERCEIEILEPVELIVMNASDLVVTDASLVPGWASAGDETDVADSFSLGVELDGPRERVVFAAPSEDVPPGRYTLSCSFSGVLNDKLCGFYRSVFTDESGAEHVIATTQFEETDARRAFPCFDEPDRKAVFSITLDAPAGMLAISNAREIASEELAGGGGRVRFADTIVMSSYLVAFVVGPLEATDAIDVDGVALRIVHLPGKEHLCAPAMEAAAHSLRYFADYFALSYPGEKLDLVAIPDFAAGAMENLGCVTFREAILLADPDRVSRLELERLTEVVAHELAHMWFGDLVTMAWWNGIWLNEAFATFMSMCCADDYRPEWEVFNSFAHRRAGAFGVDGLHSTRPIEFPVESPDEVAAMFDVLTYEKGASVLWMLERYLGSDRFRSGVRRYLAAHAFGNTETHDLWDAIEAEAGDIPIRAIMESWIFQGGYPLVSASLAVNTEGSEVVELAQSPFTYLPEPLAFPGTSDAPHSSVGARWIVPLLVSSPGSGEPAHVLLESVPAQIAYGRAPVVANAGGSGFFRLAYDAALRAGLLGELETLLALERYNLTSDTWAACLAERAPLDTAFDLFDRLGGETDAQVLSVVAGALALLDVLAPQRERPRLASYVQTVLSPHLARIGWDPAAGEDSQTPLLRATLLVALGTIGGDMDVAARAREMFVDDQSGARDLVPDTAAAVLGVVAFHARQDDLDAILARYRRPRDPLDEMRHLNALARVSDTELAAQVHALALGEIRSQNAPYVLASMLTNRAAGASTWAFVSANFDAMLERFPANSIHRMLEGVTSLAQVDEDGVALHAGSVRALVGEKITGGRRRLVAQSLERMEVNVRLARRLQSELGAALPVP